MSGRFRDDVEYSVIYEYQEEGEEDRASYYGGASVPFIWESRPGTPKKNHFPDCSFAQPLTPPPSYYSSSEIVSTPRRQNKVRSKLTKILSMSLFHDHRKSSKSSKKTTNYVSAGSSYSWSSTSSSSSFSSSPPSPTSTLCYANGGKKGFSSSMGTMRRALFSGPRHGSGNVNKA